ncbi:MAG: hypothetical protein IJB55_03775 [Firmicutes bacterium]|nr:hypothetical protein [Bacillota bacterium]
MRRYLWSVLLILLLMLTGCEENLAPEQYLAENYPGYEIVKTSAVGDLQAFLLKNDDGLLMVCFYEEEALGALGVIGREFSGIKVYERIGGPVEGAIIIVCGENVDAHTGYSISLTDYDPDDVTRRRQTDIQRDIEGQQYVLDIYFMDIYHQLIHANSKFENGELL